MTAGGFVLGRIRKGLSVRAALGKVSFLDTVHQYTTYQSKARSAKLEDYYCLRARTKPVRARLPEALRAFMPARAMV